MFLLFRRKPKLLAGIILSTAAVLFIISSIFFYKQNQFRRAALTADGQILQLVERHQSDGSSFYPVFTFRDTTGANHTLYSPIAYAHPPGPIGSHFPVLYPPASPDQAILYTSWLAFWGIPLITASLALFYLPLGLILWNWKKIQTRLTRKSPT